MLCAHPRIYIAHETSFYVFEELYRRSATGREFLAYYFQSPWFRWLRVDPVRVLEGLPDPLPRERVADAFAAILREKAARYGRVRYGDKTPAHASHLERIFTDFPGARVIHIIRDPRSTAISLSRMPWASASLVVNARLCAKQRREVAPFRDRVLEIRLEDLLAMPEGTMRRVLDYVGEPWDPAVLAHEVHIPDAHDIPPLPWLESAARPRSAAAAQWTSLPPAQIRAIERISRQLMAEGGYEPARLEREPGRLATWWAGAREFLAWLHYYGAYFRIGLWLRDPRHFDAEWTRTLWRRVNPGAWALYPGFEIPTAPPVPAAAVSGSSSGAGRSTVGGAIT
jgi:hypothetical protein